MMMSTAATMSITAIAARISTDVPEMGANAADNGASKLLSCMG